MPTYLRITGRYKCHGVSVHPLLFGGICLGQGEEGASQGVAASLLGPRRAGVDDMIKTWRWRASGGLVASWASGGLVASWASGGLVAEWGGWGGGCVVVWVSG